MRSFSLLTLVLTTSLLHAAGDDDYKPGPDSLAQPGVAKGEMLKDTFTAQSSDFPGTVRDYQIYLPPGFDKTKAAPFMVFQDGVIYEAPVVFDNLIAKKEIPPLIGIFIKPGVVPAANDNALPRYNRSNEYDSVSNSYATFLIDEFLPAIAKKHGFYLSTDPDDRAIAGSSSGGICAFMVAWHRPDSFRRVFTSVGTYVGIHGADQLPVLVRKFPPKPIRIFLQSGENDNNLYCGDWWMANQMMERSLTWNGYEVAHAWGTGGHNQKHATAIFPEALRWLWKGWPENKEVKANPRGDSKWRGYEVVGDGEWQQVARLGDFESKLPDRRTDQMAFWGTLASNKDGAVFAAEGTNGLVVRIPPNGEAATFGPRIPGAGGMAALPDGNLAVRSSVGLRLQKPGDKAGFNPRILSLDSNGKIVGELACERPVYQLVVTHAGEKIVTGDPFGGTMLLRLDDSGKFPNHNDFGPHPRGAHRIALTPDQTQLYASQPYSGTVDLWKIAPKPGELSTCQTFVQLEKDLSPGIYQRDHGGAMCVDTNGWLYVTTICGIQVADQCGRVNFIIPTPGVADGICFGGAALDELYIACGGMLYKRRTKAKGYISGQMAPIKPPAPKL
jgi:gluconolactonase